MVTADNHFIGAAVVPGGTGQVAVAARDMAGNLRTNTYQVSESGTGKSFTFDANGNMTSDGARTFTWDAENRLVGVATSNHETTFTYDSASHRTGIVEKANGAVLSQQSLVWCGPIVCESRSSGQTDHFFREGFERNGTHYVYAVDHLANIREIVDDAGAIRARFAYEPYGRSTRLLGDVDSLYGYAAQLNHADSGLGLARFRAYASELGQWASADPMGMRDGTNLYRYVHGNPIAFVDPLGLAGEGISCPRKPCKPRFHGSAYGACYIFFVGEPQTWLEVASCLGAGLVLGPWVGIPCIILVPANIAGICYGCAKYCDETGPPPCPNDGGRYDGNPNDLPPGPPAPTLD